MPPTETSSGVSCGSAASACLCATTHLLSSCAHRCAAHLRAHHRAAQSCLKPLADQPHITLCNDSAACLHLLRVCLLRGFFEVRRPEAASAGPGVAGERLRCRSPAAVTQCAMVRLVLPRGRFRQPRRRARQSRARCATQRVSPPESVHRAISSTASMVSRSWIPPWKQTGWCRSSCTPRSRYQGVKESLLYLIFTHTYPRMMLRLTLLDQTQANQSVRLAPETDTGQLSVTCGRTVYGEELWAKPFRRDDSEAAWLVRVRLDRCERCKLTPPRHQCSEVSREVRSWRRNRTRYRQRTCLNGASLKASKFQLTDLNLTSLWSC
jgi:hypothetical protein